MENTYEVNENINVRIPIEMRERVDKAIKNNPVKYETISHFFRVAIIKELKEVEQ